MEWNTVERAIKTETDIRTEQKGVGKLSWFMTDINSKMPKGDPKARHSFVNTSLAVLDYSRDRFTRTGSKAWVPTLQL